MKNKLKMAAIFTTTVFVLLIATGYSSLAQCSKMGHGGHSGHSSHNMENKQIIDSTIVRSGEIDVYAIDINKDGNVYQDPMHWNVISDKPGQCPICGMDLVKVTIKGAIKNLKQNDFKVKQ